MPKNLPLLFRLRAQDSADLTAQAAKDANGTFIKYSFKEVYKNIIEIAAAFQEIGIKKDDKVAIISENRREWLLADMGIASLGACDVPRGNDSLGNEIRYIISFSECTYGIFETPHQFEKVLEKVEEIPLMKTAILFSGFNSEIKEKAAKVNIQLFDFNSLMERGKELFSAKKSEIESCMELVETDDLATIIFTSGTTGQPKGVMLTHRNFIAQLEIIHHHLNVNPGDMWLSVLPVWHSFERCLDYIAFTLRSGIAYSKPIGAIMLPDMQQIQPQWMIGVPRLWESLAKGVFRKMKKTGGTTLKLFNFFIAVGSKYSFYRDLVRGRKIRFTPRLRSWDFIKGVLPFILLWPLHKIGDVLIYSKIKATLGGKIRGAISGGGALQPDIDKFYQAIGFNLMEGYGITEAAPVLSVRSYKCPRPGCVGDILKSAEMKVVKEVDGKIIDSKPLKPGEKGLLLARGDQIMKGYYKRPDLTAEVIDKDGWLNTGDLGTLTWDNEVKITGRAKDTIVLLGGENIEPHDIEAAIQESDFIENVVLLGQDKKFLGALIVPQKDVLIQYAKDNNINYTFYEELCENPQIKLLFQEEIESKISVENGFRKCEHVYRLQLLPNSFEIGKELSGKQEIMRHKVRKLYNEEIESLFS
ncbi:MAG: long-chain fatty acid--CoA ligase [Treponema sp. CETP13]|nr:MAG: long-chain fatty acid--CoA ligase [Treponema sp. CETP13]